MRSRVSSWSLHTPNRPRSWGKVAKGAAMSTLDRNRLDRMIQAGLLREKHPQFAGLQQMSKNGNYSAPFGGIGPTILG